MDLSTVITKIDKHNYLTAKDFLTDIDLICSNALEYNPDKDPGGKDLCCFGLPKPERLVFNHVFGYCSGI